MHEHSHHHSHDGAHKHDGAHDHAHGAGASERRIGLAALLTGAFMLAEVAGGLVSGSLALLADAGHMLTDFAGLVLAWIGFRLARRPADWKRSYGYDRFGVLVAFVNGLALFVVAGWIVVEAVHRLNAPSPVLGGIMFWVALAGLGVNLLSFRLLQGGDHGNLNMRAAVLHVIGDLLGSVAALAASLVILTTGWTPIDPILSVLVALLILGLGGAGGTRCGAHPARRDTDRARSAPDRRGHQGVGARGARRAPRACLVAEPGAPCRHPACQGLGQRGPPEAITSAIKTHLLARYGVDHATVELEFEHCADANKLPPGHTLPSG